jgi:DNA-binding LytR/AlgR family response regulator
MDLKDIKLLLLDDQDTYLQLLSIVLKDIGVEHIALARSYQEVLSVYDDFDPDICLLDIELDRGQKTGVDVALAIRQQDSTIPIIFLTSHFQDDFYEKVKVVRPSSFMNKELSRLKLLQAIELAMLQLGNHRLQENLQQHTTVAPKAAIPYINSSQVFFKIGDTYKAIDLKTIDFFFADDKLTYARVGARNFPTNVQLKILEEELGPRFLRCHKKFLVNTDAIETIMVKDGKVKIGKELLSIGYAYRKSFLEGLKLLK